MHFKYILLSPFILTNPLYILQQIEKKAAFKIFFYQ